MNCVVSMKICYQLVILGPGKLEKSPGKALEKSLNLFRLMVYEPCQLYLLMFGLNSHCCSMKMEWVRMIKDGKLSN